MTYFPEFVRSDIFPRISIPNKKIDHRDAGLLKINLSYPYGRVYCNTIAIIGKESVLFSTETVALWLKKQEFKHLCHLSLIRRRQALAMVIVGESVWGLELE